MSCSDGAAMTDGSAPRQDSAGGATTVVNAAALIAASAATSDTSRSLIVDERFFEEQFLRCQICHERFDQAERSPKSLPCNHTFCLPCLTQIFDHAQPPARRTLLWAPESLDGTLKCPTCRVEIFLSRNKINELPTDHRVVQMMDFLSQAVAKSQNVCSKHDGQPLNFFCKKCLIPVCRDCTVLDHKEADGHKITDLSEAINENSAQFNEIEIKSRETLEKLKDRSDCLANASKQLDILDRSLKSEIKETFIEYRLLLEKRQDYLTSMVHQILKDQKTKINAKFAYVCEHGTQLQKLYDEFKVSRSGNDIRKLFAINQQIKDLENQSIQIAVEDDKDLYQSCEFEAQNEGSFLSDMSGLGEVRSKADPDLRKPVSAHQLVYLDLEQQRERERLIESQASNDTYDEDLLSISDMMSMYREGAETTFEEDEPQSYWPAHSAVMSQLMSHYARLGGGVHESMDEGDSVASNSRRSRRGRRSRDTNSLQVQSTLTPETHEDLNFFRTPLLLTSSGNPNTHSAYVRSGSRHRNTGSGSSGANYRVVRHPTASSLRSQPTFGTDDSN